MRAAPAKTLRPSRFALGFGVACIVVLLASCSSAARQSPGEALATALLSASEGDLETAELYFSDDMQQAMQQGIGAFLGGTAGFAEYYTRDGELENVEVLDEEIDGQRATVTVRMHYESTPGMGAHFGYGSQKVEETEWDMVREEDGWKIPPEVL